MSAIKNPMHPGKYLMSAYLKPLKIGVNDFARHIGVSSPSISRLCTGKSDLSYDMAVRLSAALGNTAQQWVNIQNAYSLNDSEKRLKNKVAKIKLLTGDLDE